MLTNTETLPLLAPVCVHTENLFFLLITAEEYFTRKSMVDVRELKENHPEFALLLETSGDESTRFSNLSHTKVPVEDLTVGSRIMSSWFIVISMFLSLVLQKQKLSSSKKCFYLFSVGFLVFLVASWYSLPFKVDDVLALLFRSRHDSFFFYNFGANI